MVLSPTFGVRNVHLVAQNVPYHAGLLPHFKRFDGCQTVQSIKHLVACERAAIARPSTSSSNCQNSRSCTRSSVHSKRNQKKTPDGTSRRALDVQQESDCDGIEIIGDHAQHLRRGDAQRLRNRAQQLGAGLFLATLHFGEVAQRHSGLFAHLTQRFVVMGA